MHTSRNSSWTQASRDELGLQSFRFPAAWQIWQAGGLGTSHDLPITKPSSIHVNPFGQKIFVIPDTRLDAFPLPLGCFEYFPVHEGGHLCIHLMWNWRTESKTIGIEFTLSKQHIYSEIKNGFPCNKSCENLGRVSYHIATQWRGIRNHGNYRSLESDCLKWFVGNSWEGIRFW